MFETQDDTSDNRTNPELDNFVESVAKVNDGLSDMIASALRLQMLIMEDARNMMAEFGEISAEAGVRGMKKGDT